MATARLGEAPAQDLVIAIDKDDFDWVRLVAPEFTKFRDKSFDGEIPCPCVDADCQATPERRGPCDISVGNNRRGRLSTASNP